MPGPGCCACISFPFLVWLFLSEPSLAFLSLLVIPDYERITILVFLLDLYLSIIQFLLFLFSFSSLDAL